MAHMVDTHVVDALRNLVTLADRHEPEWLPDAVLADYRRTVMAGRLALLDAEPADEPVGSAVVVELPQPVVLSDIAA